MFRLVSVLPLVLLSAVGVAQTGSVNDLSFMNGAWIGPVGEGGYLEEVWGNPRGGTKQAMVRMTTPEGTGMVELIVIKEVGDSLEFRLQQFSDTMEPRFAPAALMKLTALSDNSASFVKVGEGAIAALTYTRVAEDQFNIDVTMSDGNELHVELGPQPQ